jgi:hypothetical protein
MGKDLGATFPWDARSTVFSHCSREACANLTAPLSCNLITHCCMLCRQGCGKPFCSGCVPVSLAQSYGHPQKRLPAELFEKVVMY